MQNQAPLDFVSVIPQKTVTSSALIRSVWLILTLVVSCCLIRSSDRPTPPTRPRYDCSGGLQKHSKEAEAYIEEAENEALRILRSCPSCRRLFDPKDDDYAIELLEGLRRDQAIILSTSVPKKSQLNKDGTLKVEKPEKFNDTTGAETIDLFGKTPVGQPMKLPCIYVNANAFMATGRPAEKYGLYGLTPPIQRAAALLHELAHAAGILQSDGKASKDGNNDKSGDNTNCIRQNCISCSAFAVCPNGFQIEHKRNNRMAFLDFQLSNPRIVEYANRLPFASLAPMAETGCGVD